MGSDVPVSYLFLLFPTNLRLENPQSHKFTFTFPRFFCQRIFLYAFYMHQVRLPINHLIEIFLCFSYCIINWHNIVNMAYELFIKCVFWEGVNLNAYNTKICMSSRQNRSPFGKHRFEMFTGQQDLLLDTYNWGFHCIIQKIL